MGDTSAPQPALAIIAAFTRHPAAHVWGRARAIERLGPIVLESEPFEFKETSYYEPTMGPDLRKQFWAFEKPLDPSELAQLKLETNSWELEYADRRTHSEARPLNLDPGYITPAKLVLASTKDHAHRIYLAQGIYAEITLMFRHRRWEHHEWTFPDYRRDDYQQFFSQCRDFLNQQLRSRD